MSEKEKRIRAITQLYYSNPKIKEMMLKFSHGREVVPRYNMETFGKRPDVIQYSSDIDNLVKRGATSFHVSEEVWHEPLNLSSDMTMKEMNELRKDWDLLIDVDSNYFDVSKILSLLILEKLEEFGIENYGIKFSGSRGFHIIISGKAFPDEFEGAKKNESFPEWPRAICEYLMHSVRRDFNKAINELFKDVEEKKFLDKNEIKKEALCPECGRPTKKGKIIFLKCPECGTTIQRKDMKITKKRLKCIQDNCAGVFEIVNDKSYFECESCKNVSSIDKREISGRYKATFTDYAKENKYSAELVEEHSGTAYGMSDLVLVAPRHLFRMPYSLHEKTALASVVLRKNEIKNFKPGDATPLKVEVKEFFPDNREGEANRLLMESLAWKKEKAEEEGKFEIKKYNGRKFEDVKIEGVTDKIFPKPIKKLLNGLEEGRKRGLFILLTFFKSCGFSSEEIFRRIKEWNGKNKPSLKEGYVKSQIDWHLRQRKKILPPNYANENFYKDLGLLDGTEKVKNPIVEIMRKLRERD